MAEGIELSILIATIDRRKDCFDNIYKILKEQLWNQGIWNEVEILYECDDCTMSIGNKRQLLLSKSRGEFVCFIDDDDMPSDDYCIQLWRAVKGNDKSHCVGFLQHCTFNGSIPVLASLSNKWNDWGENIGGFRYVRTPFFPTPIRRSIAIEIGYKDMRFGEDHDFAIRLKKSGLIKEEFFINKVLYNYIYTYQDPKLKYGI